ncbi:MAG: polyprenyl synthetase family protein [Pseudomonadota bacterium]
MLPFLEVVKPDLDAVNRLIIAELGSEVQLIEEIGQYLINAGGKRLRPMVALLAARCGGAAGERPVALAAIVELIHTATLLHDDVVDTSELRRGRTTANSEYGNAASVLVGDFLYSRAFQLMVRIGEMRVMQVLADATNTIAEGEVQQLLHAGNPDLDGAAYAEVIRKKTAALFQAAAEAGALIGGVPAAQTTALRLYGHHLGMAFQLVDDVLDYQADAARLGKNLGDDLAEGKMTLPLIRALAGAAPAEAALIRGAITGRGGDLAAIAGIVSASGALEYTRQLAGHHAAQAQAALAQVADSAPRRALLELAGFAAQREF